MYRIIVIFFVVLLLQLHVVKSKKTFEFFRKACKKNKSCDAKFISNTLNNINKRIDKLGKKVKTEILGIGPNDRIPSSARPSRNEKEMANMVNWFDKKINVNKSSKSIFLNKDGTAKSPQQILAEKKRIAALKKQNMRRLQKMNKANQLAKNKPRTKSEKLADKLVNQTINSSAKGKAYNELLTEWVDLSAGNIIKDDKELSKQMKKVMGKKFKDKERKKLRIQYGITGLTDKEEIDNEIKNRMTRPILNKAKAKARHIANISNFTINQLRSQIAIIKKSEVESAKKAHDDA